MSTQGQSLSSSAHVRWWFWLIAACIPTAALAAWSYTLLDPNLILLNNSAVIAWQQWWWQWSGNQWIVTLGYILPMALWWLWYARFSADTSPVRAWMERPAEFKQVWWILAAVTGVLFLGHNALSHDIFNYIFNAKMVVVFGANPHVQTALEFASDPWVRFMHNVHTPAPYAYGWTVWSIIPFLAGGAGKVGFLLVYLSMRFWMVLGLMAWWYALWQACQLIWPMQREARWAWTLGALHPLVLLETAMIGHNDVWMMAPALLSLVLVAQRPVTWKKIVMSVLLLAFSISTKYVTVLLVPIWGALLIEGLWRTQLLRWMKYFRISPRLLPRHIWPELATLAMCVPLFLLRSQQFHPWYFIWVLSFWPLLRLSSLRLIVLAVSVSSSFRYFPWLWNDLQYTSEWLQQQKLITWSGVGFGVAVWLWCDRVIQNWWEQRSR